MYDTFAFRSARSAASIDPRENVSQFHSTRTLGPELNFLFVPTLILFEQITTILQSIYIS